MSKITTDDCKNFLMEHYPDSGKSKWKRVSKYKDDVGLWCREFNHPSVGDITIIENNGTLSLKQTAVPNPIDIKNNTIIFRQFSKKDNTDAKRLIKRYIGTIYGENEEDEEEEEFIQQSTQKGYEAIPNQINYFFTLLDEEYEDQMKRINENKDYNAKLNTFILYIYPNQEENYDQHIGPLLENFLGPQFSEDTECIFSTSFDEPMSIKDFVQMMSSKGFVYAFLDSTNPQDNETCLLADTVRSLDFVTVKESTIVKSDADLPKLFKKAVERDDVVCLKDLLRQGLPLDTLINRISLHSYCIVNDAPNCFKLLVNNTPNLAKGTLRATNTVWSDMINFGQQPSNFNYTEYVFEYGNFDFRDENYNFNLDFLELIISQQYLFEKFKSKSNDIYRALACLYFCIQNENIYNVSYIAEEADKAIDQYPEVVGDLIDISIAFGNNAINISDTLMQKLIDSDRLKISGIRFEDYIIRSLDIIKNNRHHLSDSDKHSGIQFYTSILKRIQDKSKI